MQDTFIYDIVKIFLGISFTSIAALIIYWIKKVAKDISEIKTAITKLSLLYEVLNERINEIEKITQ